MDAGPDPGRRPGAGGAHGASRPRAGAGRPALAWADRLIPFEEDTPRPRPLRIRLIIEFLGTFVLVTVAAGSGVINRYVGGGPISRTAAVIAPGAVVMAMIYA